MKRLFRYSIPVILILAMAFSYSCRTSRGREGSPQAVAEKFLMHMGRFEFEEARKLGTEKTNRLIDMLEVLMDLSKEKGKDSIFQKKDIQVEVLKVAVDGNVAVVTYRNEKGKEQMLDLLKEKGKWLVDLKKESPNLNDIPGKFKTGNKKE
jgi:hypothetical protein